MKCPYCSGVIADNANFCTKCGHKIIRCPTCHRVLEFKQKTCPFDGTEFSEELLADLPEFISEETIKLVRDETIRLESNPLREEKIAQEIHDQIKRKEGSPIRYCKECGKQFLGSGTLCDDCKRKKASSKPINIERKKRKFSPLIVVLLVLLMVILCTGIVIGVYFILRDSTSNASSDDDGVASFSSEVEDNEVKEDDVDNFDESSAGEGSDGLDDGLENENQVESELTPHFASESDSQEKGQIDLAAENMKKAQEYSENAVAYDDHAYAIFDYMEEGLGNFDDCEKFCERMGGHLAVINSQAENDFLFKYISDSGLALAFFGYTDQDKEGDWHWVTDTDNTYSNWNKSDGNVQPNNGAANSNVKPENYAEFFKKADDGTWNDAPFGANTYHFICEWE